MARGRAAREQSQLFGNRLYNGENLAVLRAGDINPESVDLIYLDPPFNSNRDYNTIFKEQSGLRPTVQQEAFKDTWAWNQNAMNAFHDTIETAPPRLVRTMLAFRSMIGENDMLAYLSMMAPRLVEMWKVLKGTGSIYLHCDRTASHYLKMLMDSVFEPVNFLNEITWKRTHSHGNVGRNFGSICDTLLVYTKTQNYTWNQQYRPLSEEHIASYKFRDPDGRRWRSENMRNPGPRPNLHYPYTASNGITYQPHPNGWICDEERMRKLDAEGRLHFPTKPTGRLRLKMYLDESPGIKLQNLWDDIPVISSRSAERLGYPTQKPERLLERIVLTSSNVGDVVLDPFCGCGTTIAVAQRTDRQWIGIDHAMVATDVIQQRLHDTYGDEVKRSYEFIPKPVTAEDARKLKDSPYLFEWWAIERAGAQPSTKRKGPDQGIDGRIYFREQSAAGKIEAKQVVISVKAGHTGPAHVRELRGVIEREDAAIGVLITLRKPTKAMYAEAARGGRYFSETWKISYPRLQIVTVEHLMKEKPVDYPGRLPVVSTQEAAQVRESRPQTLEPIDPPQS